MSNQRGKTYLWGLLVFLSLILLLATLSSAAFAEDPRPTKTPQSGPDVEETEDLHDLDRNKILDNLDKRIRQGKDEDPYPVVLLFNHPLSEIGFNDLKSKIGDFQVASTYHRINGAALVLNAKQIRAAAKLGEVQQLEFDAVARIVLDTATFWYGVNKARTDFGVTGDVDGLSSYSKDDLVIAVIDTGIDPGHADLDGGKVVCWRDEVNGRATPYDDNGHGTHVASIAAGEGQANSAFTGVAPGAALVGVKVLNSAGWGTSSQVLNGIQWAIDNRAACGIEVINLSLGIAGSSDGTDAVSQMVNSAVAAGLVAVVAAGNEGPKALSIGSPGAAASAITVGSMADPGEGGFFLSSFSSRGPTADGRVKPDVVSPGHRITAAMKGTTASYTTKSGTSMATPFTAGVVAIILDASPSLSPAAVKATLTSAAQDWGPSDADNDYGVGRLDAYAAIRSAKGAASGSSPAVPNHQFFSGSLPGTGASVFHDITVTSASYPIAITFIMPTWSSVDFDIFLRNPSGTLVAFSDGVSRQETIAYKTPTTGVYKLEVFSYSGSGPYFMDTSAGTTPPDTAPPSAPTGLTVTVPVSNGGRLDLDWTDNTETDLAGYNVYRSITSGGPYVKVNTSLIAASAYADAGLTNGTTYYYVATAVDTSGNESGKSNEASGAPKDNLAPAAPTGLSATAGDQQVTLNWISNPEPDIAGYNLYRSIINGGPYTKLNASLVTATSYNDTGLTNGTTYYYVVTAVDTAGNESVKSTQVSAMPKDMTPPAAPTGLTASPGDKQVSLGWNANSEADLLGYNVHRSTVSGGPYAKVNAAPVAASSYLDTGLKNGTTYYYVVTALDTNDNESAKSNEALATPRDATPPAAPTGLTVNAPVSNGGRLDLDWSDNAEPDLAGYNLYRSTVSGGPYTKVNTSLVIASVYTDTGLANGTTYYYAVTAVDTSGNESGKSNEASGSPKDNLAPAVPTGLSATAGNQEVSLDWADNAEADLAGYNIHRSTISGGPYTKVNASLVTTSAFSDTGLTNGTTYYYVVTAVDASGNESAHSPQVSGTPKKAILYFSLRDNGLVGGLSVANEDIVAFDGANFSLYFKGSNVGLAAFTLDAFAIVDPNLILMSFSAPGGIPGISGTVDDSDIVKFTASSLGEVTAGSFERYFDGSDVGLSNDSEDIDAVELLADGRLLISTTGSFTVPGLFGQDEDILSFTPASFGANTTGAWALYFDGSDVGLNNSSEDVDAIAVDSEGKLYLSTEGTFAVAGVSGSNEDVFVFIPSSLGSATAGTYEATLFLDGSVYGLGSNDINAMDLP